MVKIGRWYLRETFSLLIPTHEEASIDIDLRDRKSTLFISFNDAAPQQGLSINPKGEYDGQIVFAKWDNAIGTALKEPAYLASLGDGNALFLLASNYRIGDINQLELQFLVGSEK